MAEQKKTTHYIQLDGREYQVNLKKPMTKTEFDWKLENSPTFKKQIEKAARQHNKQEKKERKQGFTLKQD
jgi:hypothetical protein